MHRERRKSGRSYGLVLLFAVFCAALLVCLFVGSNDDYSQNYLLRTDVLLHHIRGTIGGAGSLPSQPPQISSSSSNNNQKFPTLPDTLEMARLSLLVYLFRHEQDDASVCRQIRAGNFSVPSGPDGKEHDPGREIFPDLRCHWYYHDRENEGTQVMIVSSKAQNHLSVVFAGTDDIQTSLVDTDVRWEPLGDGTSFTLPQEYSDIRVHAGFDHAVFRNSVMDQILHQIEHLRHDDELAKRRVFVTGHSLGAAAAILTSVAMVEYYYNVDDDDDTKNKNDSVQVNKQPQEGKHGFSLSHWWWPPWHHHHHHQQSPPPEITSINFGCPRIGNSAYREYFPHERLNVWRVVWGWDLVPRLPDFFQHAGHTVQLSLEDEPVKSQMLLRNNNREDASVSTTTTTTYEEELSLSWPTSQTNKTQVVKAYYEHYGNATLGYAGVPAGWASRPYFWVPGALESHHILRYRSVLEEWETDWVTKFERVDDPNGNDPSYDDDMWVDPPFDDFPGSTY